MTEVPDDRIEEPVSRRGLIGKGGVAVAGAVVAAGMVAGAAEASTPKVRTRTWEVAPDMSTFGGVLGKGPNEPYPTGPFFIQGPIFKKGGISAFGVPLPLATPIGTYRAWGWIYDPRNFFATASQTFEIGGEGEIHTMGLQGGARLGVLGGTGPYKDARGEGVIAPINPANLSFRVVFRLI